MVTMGTLTRNLNIPVDPDTYRFQPIPGETKLCSGQWKQNYVSVIEEFVFTGKFRFNINKFMIDIEKYMLVI